MRTFFNILKYIVGLFVIIFFCQNNLYPQNRTEITKELSEDYIYCGFETLSNSSRKKTARTEVIRMEETIVDKVKRQLLQKPILQKYINIEIPIVFHILHLPEDEINEGTNLPQAQITSQLNVLNDAFKNLALSNGQILSINFCPVVVNNENQLTFDVGINRIPIQNDWIYYHNDEPTILWNSSLNATENTQVTVKNTIKNEVLWNTDCYLNVIVSGLPIKHIEDGVHTSGYIGVSSFPYMTDIEGLDMAYLPANPDAYDIWRFEKIYLQPCIGISHKALGSDSDGDFDLLENKNKGKLMVHEVGHFLGLRHIWGDGNCDADDFCNDTPRAASPNLVCAINNSCNDIDYGESSDPNDLYQNYMDYSPDNCKEVFTSCQADRMYAALNSAPKLLAVKTSMKCDFTWDWNIIESPEYIQYCDTIPIKLFEYIDYNNICGFEMFDYNYQWIAENGDNIPSGLYSSYLPSSETSVWLEIYDSNGSIINTSNVIALIIDNESTGCCIISNPNEIVSCTNTINYVCGCNNVTYINPCIANIYVHSYSLGMCRKDFEIHLKTVESELRIFPNPSVEQLNIRGNNSLDDEVSINIYNVRGQLVFNYEGNSINQAISIEYWTKGVYFIQIKTNQKKYHKLFTKL